MKIFIWHEIRYLHNENAWKRLFGYFVIHISLAVLVCYFAVGINVNIQV